MYPHFLNASYVSALKTKSRGRAKKKYKKNIEKKIRAKHCMGSLEKATEGMRGYDSMGLV